jgi:hypothetical protein
MKIALQVGKVVIAAKVGAGRGCSGSPAFIFPAAIARCAQDHPTSLARVSTLRNLICPLATRLKSRTGAAPID